MLSPEILRQIKMLELRAGRAVTDVMAGQYVSTFKGRGMEFDEVREYIPGDEVRLIDWNVTARLGTPHIKILREERELTMIIVCDVSASQSFQGFHRPKRDVAAEMAAVMAFLASRSQDRVGLVLASDQIEEYTPPRKGRGHVWRMIREVLTYQARGRGTDLDKTLRFVDQVQKRRALIFVLSDFLDATPRDAAPKHKNENENKSGHSFSSALGLLARRHDVVAVRICDPQERRAPAESGMVEIADAESGTRVVVDTSNKVFQREFSRWWTDHDASFGAWVRRSGARTFDVSTAGNTVKPLADFLAGGAQR